MARFSSSGLDEIIEDMEKMGQTTGALADKMLLAGAEQVKIAWKEAATKHGLRLTSQMFNSINYSRKIKTVRDVKQVDIYPMGMSTYTQKNGKKYARQEPVRNAEVAFINNYGTPDGTVKATHFVDTADDIAGPKVEEVLRKIYDEWLGENGYM